MEKTGKNHFTADWHNGEQMLPNTHSFLRPRPTDIMVQEWLKDAESKIKAEDTLYFVGDLGIHLADIGIYHNLPKCRKILVLGDKEYANKNFSLEEFKKTLELQEKIFDEICESTTVKIGDTDFFVAHKPEDCLKQELPAICGHIHGIWRSAEMPNKQPIINVGIDVWGGMVSEEFITHQYNAITKFYDINAFPSRWK